MKYSNSVRISWVSCSLSHLQWFLLVFTAKGSSPIRGGEAAMGNACPHRSQVTQILAQQKCHCCLPLCSADPKVLFKKVGKWLDTPFHWKNILRVGEISWIFSIQRFSSYALKVTPPTSTKHRPIIWHCGQSLGSCQYHWSSKIQWKTDHDWRCISSAT